MLTVLGACGTDWPGTEATRATPPRGDGLAEGRGGLSVRVRVQAWRPEWGGGSREDERERREEGAERREERRGERREEGPGRRRDQGAGRQQAGPGRCSLPGWLLGQRVLAAPPARRPSCSLPAPRLSSVPGCRPRSSPGEMSAATAPERGWKSEKVDEAQALARSCAARRPDFQPCDGLSICATHSHGKCFKLHWCCHLGWCHCKWSRVGRRSPACGPAGTTGGNPGGA